MYAENAEIFNNPLSKWIKEEKVLFAYFLALPRKLRNKEIQSQNQFSNIYWIDITTLSRWKKEEHIQRLKQSFMSSLLENKTVEVISNLYEAATYSKDWKVDVPAIKLWLEFFESWFLGKKEKRNNINVYFSK